VLTISTSGTVQATIKLAGSYTSAGFTLSADGAGGTKIIDPHDAGLALTAPLVQAISGHGGGGSIAPTPAYRLPRETLAGWATRPA
jgi:hypothetical protein